MNPQAPRSYTRLAAAIVVAALLIAVGISASRYFGTETTVTRTNTVTQSTTITVLSVSQTATSVLSSPPTSSTTLVFNYTSMPSNFTAAGYVVQTQNSVGYEQPQTSNVAGYEYSGAVTVFSITSQGETQTVPFFWNGFAYPWTPSQRQFAPPPVSSPSGASSNATVFGGNVLISWSKQNLTFYVTFTLK
jgi:hypothetical protein